MWTSEEKSQLLDVLQTVAEMQHSYGKQVDPEKMLKGYQLILENKLSANIVIEGIGKFLERNRDLPSPSDINNIVNPEPEKLSNARYVQACERLKRHGIDFYEQRQDDKKFIAAYEAEQSEAVKQKQEVPEIAGAIAKKLAAQ